MSGKEWKQEISGEKDYYKVLGVGSNATNDELKAAYVQLALLHHPDTARSGEEEKASSEFIKVAEAWSILSKPDNRTRYDLLRNAYLGLSPSTLSSDGTYISSEPVGFSEMKNNYTYNIQRKAGGSREDTQEKLRSEKWHNLPLKDKKAFRSQKVSGFGFGLTKVLLPAAGAVLLMAFTYNTFKDHKR
uniref:J domain-containing protein n=1 Tax=Spumella elongata TaxID=89044 RepID=A0A7S3GWJ6_9STRA|mmetsp:Transcript_22903/g.39594  ORF Transcript_22903/g.39594 Transcript_22903/m.39594 type:complete len:188 (+) Transcript_22903:59-622(+)|eukprot:CAMPEP_0184989730 /NCGR_PEP_ID=MMETSP1098-20130426/29764_1 /TAXON_ID=89044 /ORGANISM="Spumella elongata, Strain CCAP 955/1" /LENGTH=187 /DNA_ID=CAMNT_0027514783 /DNA_START=59 /DNA_END=622 /DNA_ORIENTATION=+